MCAFRLLREEDGHDGGVERGLVWCGGQGASEVNGFNSWRRCDPQAEQGERDTNEDLRASKSDGRSCAARAIQVRKDATGQSDANRKRRRRGGKRKRAKGEKKRTRHGGF